jgi:chemotaxis protein CheY-P-specific phosphatase CheC
MIDLQIPHAFAGIARSGAENAGTMLARWLRRPVGVEVASAELVRLDLIPEEEVGSDGEATFMLASRVKGELPGHTVAHLSYQDAAALVAALGGVLPDADGVASLGEMERSMLQETANILFSSLMNGLATGLGLDAVPYAPAVRVDFGTAAWGTMLLESAEEADEALVVTARLACGAGGPRMRVIFLAAPQALAVIRARLAS